MGQMDTSMKYTKLMQAFLEGRRIPQKYPGQDPKKHSDLYTDENPKGTIHGLGFKTGADAATVNKAIYPFVPKLNKAGELVQPRIPLLKRKKQGNLRSKLIMLSRTGKEVLKLITTDE